VSYQESLSEGFASGRKPPAKKLIAPIRVRPGLNSYTPGFNTPPEIENLAYSLIKTDICGSTRYSAPNNNFSLFSTS
jgi:hypothetical protein